MKTDPGESSRIPFQCFLLFFTIGRLPLHCFLLQKQRICIIFTVFTVFSYLGGRGVTGSTPPWVWKNNENKIHMTCIKKHVQMLHHKYSWNHIWHAWNSVFKCYIIITTQSHEGRHWIQLNCTSKLPGTCVYTTSLIDDLRNFCISQSTWCMHDVMRVAYLLIKQRHNSNVFSFSLRIARVQ